MLTRILLIAAFAVCLTPIHAAQTLTPEQAAAEAFLFTPSGFDQEGRPVWASGEQTGRLQIVVRDAATRQITPCRINVVGPDGNYYQPSANRLSPFALTGAWPLPGSAGNRIGKAPYRYYGRFFYTTGESTVLVPPGHARVEVWKGFEYRPEFIEAEVKTGETRHVEISLTPAAPMAAADYYVGDSHLHFLRQTDTQDQIMFDLLEAEGLRYGCALAYNHPPGPYAGFMEKLDFPQRRPLGRGSIRTRGNVHIISGQEYRSGTYGHMNLYLLDDIVFPGKNLNADNWPVYGEVARQTRAQGGFAMMAHGGYAQEVWADAALGTINAVELLQFGVYRGVELEGWYDMLNTGYRLPAAAACDYPPCRYLADCRTYVYHATAPTMPEWIEGLNRGRSFFTTAPLLLLEVDGEKPGAQIRKSGSGPHRVTARVRVRSEITPITDLALIVNGKVVEHRSISRAEGQGRWIELERGIELTESAWIAARAWSQAPINQPDAEAHTNPVYVYLNHRAPYRRGALDAWVAKIDGEIARHAKRNFTERPKVLAYFQQARDRLMKIRAQNGLTADDDPAKLVLEVEPKKEGRDLANDGSIATPTDAELKEFLKPLPPTTPAEALKSFETAGNFHLELMAAEPMVRSPVAAAFDENGNLYVAEMRDYPYNIDQPVKVAWQQTKSPASAKPLGSIRLLRDTDGDGRYDQSTVFADGLLWAAGIQPWRGGVFVTAPPNIWYLKDTDGDGKADVREIVFTGFGAQNQQAMLNSLQFGLDHLIYASTGGNGGDIRPGGDLAAPAVSVKNRDIRFDPNLRRLELLTGAKQFGLTFDDWGNRFLCSQADPVFHVVLPVSYLERNPYFTPVATIFKTTPSPTPIFRISPVERWRHIRSSRRVAEGVRAAEGEGVSHHVIDAGSGVTVYRGGAYPREYYGNIFTPDGQNNLVHRRVLVPDGATFKTERADPGTEFLRSSDIWFRPTNLLNAPDGTLWCLDMAREYLETINIPADVEKHLDLTSGRDHGRIYRIAPAGFRPAPPPTLGRASSAQLVAILESPHGWWRDTAHRLIFERQDRSIVTALETLVANSTSARARVHALWSLQGLASLSDRVIMNALADAQSEVRENAVRLAEPRLDSSTELRERVALLARDPEPHVRLQVAFAIGETGKFSQSVLLAQIARDNADDPWIRSAVLSSAVRCSGELFASTANDPRLTATDFLRQLANVIGAEKHPTDVARTIEILTSLKDAAVAFPLLSALGEGLKRAGTSLSTSDSRGLLKALFREAPQTALDTNKPEPVRRAAVDLLAQLPYSDASPALGKLLGEKHSPALQALAISALAQFRDAGVTGELLRHYENLSRALRARVIDVLLQRTERTEALCEALEKKMIGVADLTPAQANTLRQHRDEGVRQRTAAFLSANNVSESRERVYQASLPALRLTGAAERGRPIFEARCAACHHYAGVGFEFGPDLGAARSGGREKLLSGVVDPNREVLPQYIAYSVETKDGDSLLGFLENETGTTVTLRQPGGIRRTLARSRIITVKSQERSLMPEGLEVGLAAQDISDLIEFIVNPSP